MFKRWIMSNNIQTQGSLKKPRNIFKFVGITVVMVIAIYSLFIKSSRTNTYALEEPTYPAKIKFGDLDEKMNRREKIDENFLKNLRKFSTKSSSLVLSKTDRNENSLYSPISLYMALSMVSETASEDTQKEILEALNMDSIQMVRSETGKLFRSLYYHNEIGKLSFGNSLWLNKDIEFKRNLIDLLTREYYASSFSLDFNDKKSWGKINQWISEQTGGKFENNSDEISLSSDDAMILINTIYFYDQWVDSFDAESTSEDEFYLSNGDRVKSDFMNMTYGSHSFVGVDGYTVSSLNLKNGGQMVFILPDEGISPYDIVSDPKLLGEVLNVLSTDKRQMGEVIFKIPKFDFSSSLKLKDICKSLGMEDAFEITADFTNLSDTKPLFISGIKQDSKISINEKGVEATAFTQVDYCGAAQPDGKAEMILDRPFIFTITGINDIPLFIGIINNPNVKS